MRALEPKGGGQGARVLEANAACGVASQRATALPSRVGATPAEAAGAGRHGALVGGARFGVGERREQPGRSGAARGVRRAPLLVGEGVEGAARPRRGRG